jgi:hypothetical protein
MAICETTVCPMAFLWHLNHMNVGKVILMKGTSLTLPLRHLWIPHIRRSSRPWFKSRAKEYSCLNQKRGVSMSEWHVAAVGWYFS